MHSWTPLIATHATAAALTLLLGGYQLFRRTKGDRTHVLLGWVWAVAIAYVATSSFAIREIRDGRLSLLHVLSIVSLVSMVWAVIAIRRGRVRDHRAAMTGGWFGVVGAFAGAIAVPDRRIPTFAVTNPEGLALAVACVVVLTVVLIILARWLGARVHIGAARPKVPSA